MVHPLEPLRARHEALPAGGYAFLANVLDMDDPAGGDLDADARLRLADVAEVGELRHLLMYWGPESGIVPQENDIAFSPDGPGVTNITITRRDAPHVRYYVVDYSGSNHTLYTVQYASCLTLKPLEFGVHVDRMAWGGPSINLGGGADPGLERASEAFQKAEGSLLTLTRDDVADLRAAYDKLKTTSARAGGLPLSDPLSLTISQFIQLRRIDRSMPIRFLGSFAILESLLTRKQRETDPASSLGAQLKTKMKLLESRFVHPLTYPNKLDSAKFWSLMYGYRSSIAHGDFAAVNSPPKGIGDREATLTLLESVVSRVMRAALDEPQLLADLKDC